MQFISFWVQAFCIFLLRYSKCLTYMRFYKTKTTTCVTLPWRALKPCSGTRELPVTNCRSLALCSSSYSSTARQNQRTTGVSSEQCFNRVFRFQSSTSILPSPPIINCKRTTSNCYTYWKHEFKACTNNSSWKYTSLGIAQKGLKTSVNG